MMNAFKFRPIETWPGKLTREHHRRSRYAFKATHSDTLVLLKRELRLLNVRGFVVIQLAIAETDIRRSDGLPKESARPVHPEGMVIPYNRASVPRDVAHPAPTMTTVDPAGLLAPAVEVEDCGFRMLAPHEIGRAMAIASLDEV